MTLSTASGKSAATENFPVGSWLLPAKLRPHVATFYAFARATDDIADSATLPPAEKIKQLEAFDKTLDAASQSPDCEMADLLRQSLDQCGIRHTHAHDLISAFKQDAVQNRYTSWDELIDYCNRSAAPVGRYLLDLHGENPAHYPLSDALCNALQVINHCQDMADDKRELDRVYLPAEWLSEAGACIDDISGPQLTPALRSVLDRCLAETETLLTVARKLPVALKNKRLAAEACVIVTIAEQLVAKLRKDDPLATQVKLSKFSSAVCIVRGVLQVF